MEFETLLGIAIFLLYMFGGALKGLFKRGQEKAQDFNLDEYLSELQQAESPSARSPGSPASTHSASAAQSTASAGSSSGNARSSAASPAARAPSRLAAEASVASPAAATSAIHPAALPSLGGQESVNGDTSLESAIHDHATDEEAMTSLQSTKRRKPVRSRTRHGASRAARGLRRALSSRQGLSSGIILSEVLGPPVSERKNQEL